MADTSEGVDTSQSGSGSVESPIKYHHANPDLFTQRLCLPPRALTEKEFYASVYGFVAGNWVPFNHVENLPWRPHIMPKEEDPTDLVLPSCVDLYSLYTSVLGKGGFIRVSTSLSGTNSWDQVAEDMMSLPDAPTFTATIIREYYEKYILGFELYTTLLRGHFWCSFLDLVPPQDSDPLECFNWFKTMENMFEDVPNPTGHLFYRDVMFLRKSVSREAHLAGEALICYGQSLEEVRNMKTTELEDDFEWSASGSSGSGNVSSLSSEDSWFEHFEFSRRCKLKIRDIIEWNRNTVNLNGKYTPPPDLSPFAFDEVKSDSESELDFQLSTSPAPKMHRRMAKLRRRQNQREEKIREGFGPVPGPPDLKILPTFGEWANKVGWFGHEMNTWFEIRIKLECKIWDFMTNGFKVEKNPKSHLGSDHDSSSSDMSSSSSSSPPDNSPNITPSKFPARNLRRRPRQNMRMDDTTRAMLSLHIHSSLERITESPREDVSSDGSSSSNGTIIESGELTPTGRRNGATIQRSGDETPRQEDVVRARNDYSRVLRSQSSSLGHVKTNSTGRSRVSRSNYSPVFGWSQMSAPPDLQQAQVQHAFLHGAAMARAIEPTPENLQWIAQEMGVEYNFGTPSQSSEDLRLNTVHAPPRDSESRHSLRTISTETTEFSSGVSILTSSSLNTEMREEMKIQQDVNERKFQQDLRYLTSGLDRAAAQDVANQMYSQLFVEKKPDTKRRRRKSSKKSKTDRMDDTQVPRPQVMAQFQQQAPVAPLFGTPAGVQPSGVDPGVTAISVLPSIFGPGPANNTNQSETPQQGGSQQMNTGSDQDVSGSFIINPRTGMPYGFNSNGSFDFSQSSSTSGGRGGIPTRPTRSGVFGSPHSHGISKTKGKAVLRPEGPQAQYRGSSSNQQRRQPETVGLSTEPIPLAPPFHTRSHGFMTRPGGSAPLIYQGPVPDLATRPTIAPAPEDIGPCGLPVGMVRPGQMRTTRPPAPSQGPFQNPRNTTVLGSSNPAGHSGTTILRQPPSQPDSGPSNGQAYAQQLSTPRAATSLFSQLPQSTAPGNLNLAGPSGTTILSQHLSQPDSGPSNGQVYAQQLSTPREATSLFAQLPQSTVVQANSEASQAPQASRDLVYNQESLQQLSPERTSPARNAQVSTGSTVVQPSPEAPRAPQEALNRYYTPRVPGHVANRVEEFTIIRPVAEALPQQVWDQNTRFSPHFGHFSLDNNIEKETSPRSSSTTQASQRSSSPRSVESWNSLGTLIVQLQYPGAERPNYIELRHLEVLSTFVSLCTLHNISLRPETFETAVSQLAAHPLNMDAGFSPSEVSLLYGDEYRAHLFSPEFPLVLANLPADMRASLEARRQRRVARAQRTAERLANERIISPEPTNLDYTYLYTLYLQAIHIIGAPNNLNPRAIPSHMLPLSPLQLALLINYLLGMPGVELQPPTEAFAPLRVTIWDFTFARYISSLFLNGWHRGEPLVDPSQLGGGILNADDVEMVRRWLQGGGTLEDAEAEQRSRWRDN